MDVEARVATLSSLEDLASFLDALSEDAVDHGSQWENLQIFDMLESMAAWLRDTTENGASAAPPADAETVRFFARLLLAGKHYE